MFSIEPYLESTFEDVIRGKDDLHEDQLEALDFAWGIPFSALFLDVGKGKTVISETIVDRLLTEGYEGKILIIAPIRVATRVWMREHRLWSHLAYMTPELIRISEDDPRVKEHGQYVYDLARWLGANSAKANSARGRAERTRKNDLRDALVDSPRQIHVINQEAVGWLVEQWEMRGLEKWPYQVVIFDESSRLRDHNSQIFKALKKVLRFIRRFHQLTATPASQTYMHLFAQIYLLDRGKRLGLDITNFRARYFTQNRYTQVWSLRPGAAEEIEQRISDICIVQRREKDFQINIRSIELPADKMKQYRDFERDLVMELSDDVIIDAINGGVLSNKLLQYASGAVYDANRKPHFIHDEKIDELRQLMDETLDNPVMVAYWYKPSLARLKAAFPDAAVMDREGKMEEPWNKGKFKMMLVHPRSVAHGMNLQFGGHHIAVFDIFWPLELFTQLIGRLDRPGQESTVMVHLLSAVGTMDETVALNLQLLRSAEEAMFKRLRALYRRLRNVGQSYSF
jgi:hypothetical protein